MKKIIIALTLGLSTLFATVADSGSVFNKFQYCGTFKLIKDDTTEHDLFGESKCIDIKSSGSTTSLAEALSGTKPSNGTYTGLKIEMDSLKYQAKIITGGETYYTTETTSIMGSGSYGFSATEADYGLHTRSFGDIAYNVTFTFPTPLEVSDTEPVEMFMMYQADSSTIEFSGTFPDDISHIQEAEIAIVLLPKEPSKYALYTLTYDGDTDKTVILSLFMDESNNLMGSYMARPSSNSALSGQFLLSGSNTGTNFTLKYAKGGTDGSTEWYDITGTFDCSNQTYANITVKDQSGADVVYDSYTLQTSGSITCSDLNLEN
jgi:hypothetical protein